MKEEALLKLVIDYFDEKVFSNHQKEILRKHSKLSSYKVNPIIVRYLSKVLDDKFSPLGVAKALFYPRVLGTSINTSFGTKSQTMFIDLNLAKGSLIKGMDIEFLDKIDNRQKWCQLKSGPNTINLGDVNPLLKKFASVANLARTNKIKLNNSDLILGVLYGNEDQLSQHYRKIDETYPVIIGREFWHRITGFPNFYSRLLLKIDKLIKDLNTEDFFEKGYLLLVEEIKESDLFDFS